ncbi:response regulator transcription factor [Flavobacterium piscis]|uniref:DNA-binding NarL/FixJ family response regulator n=1 Tax=Flavobacterium piscis TaxID=1114874 RepID=A0ABU1Y2S8_9FLAO|nr:response regulator transcription factor [Flavobacterium piscis]MDR7208515.1 DNA-binding NarL/FixJ family response regulator [Flavobacterium piscis]
MKKTIVIVDDHVLIAQALKGIIENFEDFQVLYECENGKDLQDKFQLKKPIPDIVLLDISMPVMDGFETAKWLKKLYPDILIMILSMQNDDQSVIKMIQLGINGYLLKNTSPYELEKALKQVAKEGFYYQDWASRIVFASLNNKNGEQHTIKLTDREKEFLKYTITEMNYKEIAEKMFCSPRTVESYRDSLFEKLDLKTRVGLAVFALKNGFE